jgi:dTDP-glucose 4,6-dehydratase/UDP-glucose 4-epimerase
MGVDMDKVLVFGCGGFIGSHLVDYLTGRGWEVTGTDVCEPKASRQWRFVPARLDEQFFVEVLADSYSVCINCAGAASVPQSFNEPLVDFDLNARLVVQILSGIRAAHPSCRYINLSSAAVYGNPTRLPIVESMPCGPISPYGIHKHLSELICHEFSELFGIQTTSLRIFSAYGPGLRRQLLWDMFQKSFGGNGEIELFGTGKESRDFIYIDDLVRAIECIAQQPRFEYSAINVASGEESTIAEVAEMFCDSLPTVSRYRFTGVEKLGDPGRWVADVGILQSLGFETRTRLREGIAKYVDWLVNQVGGVRVGARRTAESGSM